jgi:hypothetical protein
MDNLSWEMRAVLAWLGVMTTSVGIAALWIGVKMCLAAMFNVWDDL